MSDTVKLHSNVHYEYPAFSPYHWFDRGLGSTYQGSRGLYAVAVAVGGIITGVFAYPIFGLIGCLGSLFVAKQVKLATQEEKEASVTHLFVIENFVGSGIAKKLCDAITPLVSKNITVIPVSEDINSNYKGFDLKQVQEGKKASLIFVSDENDLFLHNNGFFSGFWETHFGENTNPNCEKIDRGTRVIFGNTSEKHQMLETNSVEEEKRFFDKSDTIAYSVNPKDQNSVINLLRDLNIYKDGSASRKKEKYVIGACALYRSYFKS